MAVVQVPPAVGTSGQFIDAIIITSSTLRQVQVIGDAFTSGAFAPVTSSFGLLANVSSGGYTVRSLSSGTVTLSSNPTIISASSGLVQISGTATILSASSGFVQTLFPVNSSAGFGPVTSSAGVLVSISSGTITLSSNPTVVLSSPTSLSSGTVIMSSVQTVTATAATNPWSSAPGFNVPVLNASSGIVQVLLTGSSGGVATVTTSGGVAVSIVAGAGAGSTAVNLTNFSGAGAGVTSSGGLIITVSTIAGQGPVIIVSASSGLVQVSGAIATASSGLVQILPQSSAAMTVFSYVSSSSGNSTNIQSGNTALFGYGVFNTTGALRYVHFYNTSSAPTVGSTANWMQTVMAPGAAGANLVTPIPMNYSTRGLSFTITGGVSATDATTIGATDVQLNVYYI